MTDNSNRRLDDRKEPETSGGRGATPAPTGFVPPHPGSRKMPRWNPGELIEAPRFVRKHWYAFLGPGLVAGAGAIGGGEWLLGPLVTARYGGALLWLATLSILAQGLYNIEISRYTLYTGEPIFTGKFRTAPGPRFWLAVYLILDFGSVFPYLAATAATPVMILLLGGRMPDPDAVPLHWWMHKLTATGIFVASVIPLIFGGKVYNSLKAVMSVKLVTVFGFLLIVALLYSSPSTWGDIGSGFFKFGTVPVLSGEDRNGNGRLDPGEDWDGDGHLDVVERRLEPTVDSDGDGRPDTWERGPQGQLVKHEDLDGDGFLDGPNVENVFVSWFGKGVLPTIDFTLIAFIAAMAAIAGNGGLSNTPISNFTRDQGWGMGHHGGTHRRGGPPLAGYHLDLQLQAAAGGPGQDRQDLLRADHWLLRSGAGHAVDERPDGSDQVRHHQLQFRAGHQLLPYPDPQHGPASTGVEAGLVRPHRHGSGRHLLFPSGAGGDLAGAGAYMSLHRAGMAR